jgi:AraC-like DNA-binding protein
MLRPVRIRNYLSIMRSMGFDAASVLRGSGIDITRLEETGYLIDAAQCRAVITNMIGLSGDPGIGLEIGMRTDLVGLGIAGYATATSRVMRETLDVWARYSELLGVMSRYEVEDAANGDVIITFVEPAPTDPIFVFCVEELLTLTCKIGGIESGVAPGFVRMEFPYRAPAHRERYAALFDCPIRFGAERARVVLGEQWVNLPLLTNDNEFHDVCIEHCGRILAGIKQGGSPVAMRLRAIFLASPQRPPSLEDSARRLGMSSRTLRRRLHDEGQSFQSLLRDFRVDLAREYLNTTEMAPKQIAFLLGFDDVQAFRRAFKGWTGSTPKEYRSDAQLAVRNNETASQPHVARTSSPR